MLSRRLRTVGVIGAVLVTAAAATVVTMSQASAAVINTSAFYQLVNRNSGKAIEITGGSTADQATVTQNTRGSANHQQFQFVDSGGGYYRLRARHSNKVIDLWEWNAADGAEFRQWPDLNGNNQQFRVLDSDGGYVRLLNRHSGRALSVFDRSTANGGRISQYTDANGTHQQWQLLLVGGGTTPTTPATPGPGTTTNAPPPPPPTGGQPGNAAGLVGFATLNAYGRNGTNGGAGGTTVNVSTFAQLAAAVAGDTPRIVRVSGTITGSGPMLDVGSNKTIVGVGSNATISGFGLDINGWGPAQIAAGGDICDPAEMNSFPRVHNVIVQNLSFRNSADDSVNVQCYSHHVWIHHNTFYAANDGSVDIKRGSDLVTVSNNRFVGTDKSMLLGHSDNNAAQDAGFLRATYYGNWFDGSNTRHPRVRFGYAHLFGNYVNVTDYFIGLGVSGRIYAESNYVLRAKTITQDFGDASLTWTSSNFYNRATITRANSSGSTMSDWLRANNTVARPPYSYSAGSAPSSPPAAGAGSSGADRI
ncbi:MAG TPA: RICIN domain-containing protein [Pilimelia sp.]|nr:RICIN domain-containing protein [Pilimelia sp.]